MKKFTKKITSFLLATLMMLAILTEGITVNASAFNEINSNNLTEDELKASNDNSESNADSLDRNIKEATTLDENLETTIKLEFPGKQEVLPADVVFVLDKSGASAEQEIFEQAKGFLKTLKDETQEKGLNVKVGVVSFSYIGNIKKDLTDITSDYDGIIDAMGSSPGFGTNMHAGLLAAKDMLDKDNDVLSENKYVILISDGATYLYCKDGNYKEAYTRSFGDPKKQTNPSTGTNYLYGADRQGGIWEYQSREYNLKNDWKKFSDGSNFIFSQATQNWQKLSEYLDYYRDQENDTTKNWQQYDYQYTFFSRRKGGGLNNIITPIDLNAPSNIDVAFMRTDDTFQEMVNAGYKMNVYFKNAADFDGSEFLKYLSRQSNNGELNTDFANIKKGILDKITKGSYLTDYIGEDFDFVNDINKISLEVAKENLKPEKIDETKYGFGKLDDGTYRYVLTYTKGENENLKLEINETLYPKKPAVLKYNEKLVKVPETSGNYSFDTNKSAKLTPIDGNGIQGTDIEFPSPKVTLNKEAQNVKVTFKDSDKTHAVVTVEKGKTIDNDSLTNESMPIDPIKDGYIFKEWNTKEDGTGTSFTGSTIVNQDTVVYAIWIKQPDAIKTWHKSEKPETIKVIAGKEEINLLDHYAYMKGYPDETFGPDKQMTRAEVTMMFARLLKDRPEKNKIYSIVFNDVKENDWYAYAVTFMNEKNFVKGYPDGSFKADQPITRAEFAQMAASFDNLDGQGNNSFSDVSENHWASKVIGQAANKGWISGYPDGTFKPDKYITRAEVVSATNIILNRYADLDFIKSHKSELAPMKDVEENYWAYGPIVEAMNGHDYERLTGGKNERWIRLNEKRFTFPVPPIGEEK
ncbi:MAG: S-layer homology domain-containing protein [Peptoniphilus grossensis]|uniref:S-layer homology domain-containing protein n=1 Tax=Peptoniphilus grossensis TaxID=1465756 RepID=UPI0025900880|nr:S-layer homology domain-containing protein [Peptoniphilus grossensis]MDU5099105.1 S-layer homology domain-containing protein [Peptoniphilus grossensis]